MCRLFGFPPHLLRRACSDFSLPGSASEHAGELMAAKFPGEGDVSEIAQAKVVVHAPAGSTLDRPDNVAAVDASVSGLRGLPRTDPRGIPSQTRSATPKPGPLNQQSPIRVVVAAAGRRPARDIIAIWST